MTEKERQALEKDLYQISPYYARNKNLVEKLSNAELEKTFEREKQGAIVFAYMTQNK